MCGKYGQRHDVVGISIGAAIVQCRNIDDAAAPVHGRDEQLPAATWFVVPTRRMPLDPPYAPADANFRHWPIHFPVIVYSDVLVVASGGENVAPRWVGRYGSDPGLEFGFADFMRFSLSLPYVPNFERAL